VRAGRFQGTASNVVGVDPGIFVDNLQDVFMYCYDLYEGVSGGRVVDYTINLDGESARTLDFLGAVNAVLNGQRGTADTFAWLHPANGNEAAAIQIGIWESRYESTGLWSVVDGSFSATELASGTASTLAAFFARIADAESLDARYAMVLEARGAQDMLAGDPPVGVPSPSPAALLLVGAAALVLRRRQASCRSRSCSTS
jgi:MYXO-CTERM domain-containing protein